MEYLLILPVILVYSFQGIFMKIYSNHYTPNVEDSSTVYSVINGLFVALCTLVFRFIMRGFGFNLTPTVAILAAVNVAALFFFNKALVEASARGPYAMVSIFMLSGGIVIPLAVSLFYGESLNLTRYIGILVMFVAFVLLCYERGEQTEKKPGFYLYCIALAVANGIYGTILTLEKTYEEGVNNDELIILTYFFTAAVSVVLLLLKSRKAARTLGPDSADKPADTEQDEEQGKPARFIDAFRLNGRAIAFALGASTCTAIGINLLALCLQYINVGVLYTMENGGVMVASALLALALFREKINLQKWIGILVAAGSTVLLTI